MGVTHNGFTTQEDSAIWANQLTLVLHENTDSTTTTSAPETNGIYYVKNNKSQLIPAKGVRIKGASAGGNLEVHLVNNFDSNGLPVYTIYDFEGGDKEGLIFDQIRTDNTTITLSDVLILLR